jgi:hypothetical protein
MPTMNLGSDTQVILNGPFGSIQFDNVKDLTVKPMEKIIETSILNGQSIKRTINDGGWELTFTVVKDDNTAEALAQSNFNALTTGVPVPNGSCQTSTYNTKNGTSSTAIYSGGAFMVTDLGSYSNNKEVMQKITVKATSRAAA